MKMKMWVPIVASLVLVVALVAVPVSAQAGPVKGAEISVAAPEGSSLDTWSLAQLWNELLVAVGLGSSQRTPDTVDPSPPAPVGSSPTEDLTTEDSPLADQGDARSGIAPDG